MKRLSLALLCGAACVASASVAFAQQEPPRGYVTVLPATNIAPEDSDAALLGPAVSPLIPDKSFNYTIIASADRGGLVYSGTILGRNPLLHGKTTTGIPTQIIPLVITINDGTTTITYDPTAPDVCVPPTNPTDVSIITGSPIFTNNAWTMNGVAMGNTQYIDAFQRAEFGLQGTGYHLILTSSVLGSQALTFGPGTGTNYPSSMFVGNTCATGHIGVVNLTNLNGLVQGLITGPLAGMVNAGTFPIFLTKDVVSADPGISIFANCCVLGYHSGLFVAGDLQIYSPFSIDTTGVFGPGFVSTLSHEMAEAVNDPTTGNPTPLWGGIGQVGGCQNNFEVGDPLSPGFGTPTNPFVVVGGNGLTYHLQELAFYSWFYGSTPLGAGAGGKFSDNLTFGGDAKVCPPGGTN